MPCYPAISSMSLGRAWEHALYNKLVEASRAGLKGVEIFYEDLDYLSSTYLDPDLPSEGRSVSERERLIRAATDVNDWCEDLALKIIVLQPFMFYDGLVDRAEHAKMIEKLHLWFELAKVLGTDMIQIPSNILPPDQVSNDMDMIVQDMIEVADLGLQQEPVIRFAYENLAWGTRVDTWEQVWDVIQKVNRPNFGMCFDTFNIVGRVWADPASPSGQNPNSDAELDASVSRLIKTIDVKKIFFAQIIDAERMETPLIKGHPWYDKDQPARMSWSRNARLFAYEAGYLPIAKVMDALFKHLGYEGWISMELFSRTMAEPDASVPETHAKRAIASWEKMKKEYGL